MTTGESNEDTLQCWWSKTNTGASGSVRDSVPSCAVQSPSEVFCYLSEFDSCSIGLPNLHLFEKLTPLAQCDRVGMGLFIGVT